MDGQLDHFLSSEWVSDVNSTARSSWIGNISEQVNDFPVDPSASYQGDEKNVHKGLVSSNHMMGISCSEGMIKVLNDYRSAQLVSDNPILTEDNVLISRHEFQNKQIFHNSLPSQGGMEDQIPSGPLHFQLDIANRITGCQNLGLSLSNGVQMSGYKKLGDSLCMHSPSWSTPYSDISTFTSILGQTKLNGLPLQGDFTETDGALLGKIYPGDNITLVSDKGDFQILSLEAVSQVPLPQNDAIQLQQKLTQCGETNSSNIYGSASQLHPSAVTNSDCNGSAKSRPRARRGQATDPHSIAERTRREKIAERMKNLQELVPNSNKTDKASMLDEIIEYVKFLQLQVKVLSMSRVGATEAVIPLITDAQSQGSSILQLSASMARRVAGLPESQESIAFEQEVIKLMESNVTSAMQYLQTNGLGLMPIALASAIPGGNTTSQKPKTERSNGGFSSATNFPSVPRSLQVSSCRNEHPALKWEREEGATNSSSCAANVDGDK